MAQQQFLDQEVSFQDLDLGASRLSLRRHSSRPSAPLHKRSSRNAAADSVKARLAHTRADLRIHPLRPPFPLQALIVGL
jgi:hypothetical protein